MPKNRQVVIAICVISWSLLLLPILPHLVWKIVDDGSRPSPARIGKVWMSSISGALHLPRVVLPGLTVLAFVSVFVLVAASTVELVLSKWGIAKDEPDDPL